MQLFFYLLFPQCIDWHPKCIIIKLKYRIIIMYILLRSDSNFSYCNFRLRIIFYILFSHSAKSPMDITECCDIYSAVIYFGSIDVFIETIDKHIDIYIHNNVERFY